MQRLLAVALACVVAAVAGFPAAAVAAVQVFACEPEWAALAKELGGERVSVFAATTGTQDPHHIQARPSLIARMRSADLAVCTGAELEAGWLPLRLRQASNPKVRPRSVGYLEAADYVQKREIPALVDRRLGDVHAAGNPHIQTDPRNFLPIAKVLADRLAQLDPAGAASYRTRLADFETRWRTSIQRWEAQAAPLKGVPVLGQHKNLVYLLDWLGLREVATLEPVPGVEPSMAYLTELLKTAAAASPRMVLVAAYESDRPAKWIAERAKSRWWCCR